MGRPPRPPPSHCRSHVESFARKVCRQATVAEQLDEAARKLVQQRRRLQTARLEVRRPHSRGERRSAARAQAPAAKGSIRPRFPHPTSIPAIRCTSIAPKNEWTKPEEDVPYLTPLIKEIEAEL